ncbi:unnamed protein product [Paramecium sonneborni]|uniref:Core Histone H2A/H2B/H3 domain-containing protein n=1 Tax=Paramecium sonneborni TaxID=65129 RepID=A0A8S1LQZ1_9CILI|nr:unnamed protein product [Paramecium sonneborni]
MARTKEGKAISKKSIAKKGEEQMKSKKSKRYRPGTIALKEIRKYQDSSNLLIRKLPFQRLVRELAGFSEKEMRFQSSAILALQEATEAFIVNMLEDSVICAHHARRITVMQRDINLARRIRADNF